MKFVANQIKFVPLISSLFHPRRKNWPRNFEKKMENGGLELGLLKLPKLNFWVFEKANGRVSGAPETCFFMFFGLNAAPSKTSNLSNFKKLSNSSRVLYRDEALFMYWRQIHKTHLMLLQCWKITSACNTRCRLIAKKDRKSWWKILIKNWHHQMFNEIGI